MPDQRERSACADSEDELDGAERFRLDGRSEPGPRTYVNSASPGYFATMGIALLRGRDFQSFDRPGAPQVAIVSETFASVYFPGDDGAMLAGLSPSDPVAFAGTAAGLTLVGLLASYVPARRATRVDPMAALRQQ